MQHRWFTTSPEETQAVAAEVIEIVGERGVLLLEGDLGAGKTCFVQGLAQVMGLHDMVTSPTYGLIKEYGDPPKLIHSDLYRLTHEEELVDLGLEEWLGAPVLCAIEWPDRASGFWPANAWTLQFALDPQKEAHRVLHLEQRSSL